MILVIGNTKGGVGKSTLAVQLALLRAAAGRDVLLVDADAQGTSATAMGLRETPGVSVAQLADVKLLRSQVPLQAPKYQDVIIDAGGRDNAALRAALMLSDVVLVPFAPRSVDVWALATMAELVEEARSVKPALRGLAVLNSADPVSVDNAEAATVAADYPVLEVLPVIVRRRKAIADATGQGLSIEERTPRDPKACAELAALVSAVFHH